MNRVNASFPDIPGYTLKSILGSGGFATVYLAQQHTLQRDIALKVMNPSLVADADLCARFLREARDTASVSNHPNIITVHDVGQSESYYYIAMQYLPGPNLKQRIACADKSINASELLRTLATALAHAHERGFLHRDVKPANVLFTESGEAVLADFGVARMDNRSTELTQHGTILGTPRYRSPEQSRGDPVIDARSDLYSLGVVLFEMLVHYPPYDATDPLAMMFKHVHEPIPELPASHAAYQPVLDKLMAKQPANRYASANALLEDLQTRFPFNSTSKNLASTYMAGSSTQRTANAETRTTTVLIVAVGAIVLLAGSLLYLHSMSSRLPAAELRCPELTQTQEFERDSLLQLASVHQDIGRLVHPPGANALEAYSLALEIDPCNRHILDALSQIRTVTEKAH
ncbi:MAG: serine/threonine-protein kinase [Granulosicoccus sp.]